jgi:phosphatidylserine/phosphatidylglycerophosphate/cardiolipin synthase-like enzyme
MALDATTSERMEVAARDAMPDTGPRKDYMTRIEGPIAQDAEEIFHERWAHQRRSAPEYSENASDYEVVRDVSPRSPTACRRRSPPRCPSRSASTRSPRRGSTPIENARAVHLHRGPVLPDPDAQRGDHAIA